MVQFRNNDGSFLSIIQPVVTNKTSSDEKGQSQHISSNTTSPAEMKPALPKKVVATSDWTPLNHTNLSFPSDISCQTTTKSLPGLPPKHNYNCQRSCHHPLNKILYPFPNQAGLGDRESIMSLLVDLGGYLCATTYAPKPFAILDRAHNNGVLLHSALKWSDFLHYSWWNGIAGQAVLEDVSEEERRDKYKKWVQIHHEHNHWERWEIIQTFQPSDMITHFQKAKDISLTSSKGFIWVLYHDWYALREPLVRYVQGVEGALRLPLVRKTSYSWHTLPERLQDIADKLWKNSTLGTSANETIGSWHIRRTDAQSECNTTLPRMESYIECTFRNTQQFALTVFVQTDERDRHYIETLQTYFGAHARNVQVIWVDDLVRTHLESLAQEQHIPRSYLNNFHVFQIARAVVAKANAFQLVHRRKFDCQECFNLYGSLAAPR